MNTHKENRISILT